jgi:hypothetical protein
MPVTASGATSRGLWGRIQVAGAVLLVPLSLGAFALRGAFSPDVPFIVQGERAPWIMAGAPVSASLEQWGSDVVPVVSFSRRIVAPERAAAVALHLRALRRFSVHLNGEPVPGGESAGSRWRAETRIDLGPRLRPGPNDLRIDVVNAHGPALLSARIEGLAEVVATGPAWRVARDGGSDAAGILADDTRINPLSYTVETPLSALGETALASLALAGLAAVGFLAARRWLGAGVVRALPAAALAITCVGWLALFASKLIRVPLAIGFDARHHLAYVELLRSRHAVPFATDGWSTYHPPLFYAAVALARAAEPVLSTAVALKLLPFLAGLANVFVAFALCRQLFPGDAKRQAYAVVFAAVLPMNLYCATYFSNETFHTAVAGVALLVAVRLLLAPHTTWRDFGLLGLVLGAGLLTKFTSLIVAAVALFFLAVKLLAIERDPPARVAGRLLVAAFCILLVAGWFYARNVVRYGDPLMANWGDMPGPGLVWWQQPGFHTPAYFTSFGEALVRPYLAGFHSFWDSLYSTLWGDGGIAGRVNPAERHTFWNYDFMSAGYLVALPATLLVAAGAFSSLGVALRDPDPRRRAAFSFLLTFAYAIVFGLMFVALRLPFFAQAKASYGLAVAPVLALFFAVGVGRCDDALDARGQLALRALLHGYLAAFAGVLYLSFAG